MDKVRVSIIYYSATGANYQLSQWAAEAAEDAGTEVRRKKIRETAPREAIESNEAWKEFVNSHQDEEIASLEDLNWADTLIFSIPTRYGNMPSQFQSFIDTTGGLWSQGKLANKMVTAFTSAMNVHGGQEGTIQSLYKTMCHWGAIIVPPGYTFDESYAAGGNPYGTSATVNRSGDIISDGTEAAVKEQVKRVIDVTKAYKKGKSQS